MCCYSYFAITIIVYNSYFRFHKYGKLMDLANINWISKVCEIVGHHHKIILESI